jgi:hypothetical protein
MLLKIAAAPLARSTNIGTRRYVKYRAVTNASTSQITTTVATGPTHRSSASSRLRTNGLEAITIAATKMKGSHSGLGVIFGPSIHMSAGSRIWSNGAVKSQAVRISRPPISVCDAD